MVRWGALAAGAAVVAGAAFVTGASIPPRPAVGPPKPEEVRAAVAVGQKTGFFNMARVMKDYKRAKAGVEGLNAQRARLTANLVGLRAMYTDLMTRAEKSAPAAFNPVGWEAVTVQRMIEDTDRAVNRILNERATAVIAGLYDELHATVAEIAREHGLTAVLAFPDAPTPEEMNSPAIKELKLKPPAAHPFYLDPSVDYTDELVRRVNDKFAADPAGD